MNAPLRVVLATRNAGKAREFDRLLEPVFSVEPLGAGIEMPEETGATFAENARLKAEAVSNALGGVVAVLADDSGLEVDALGGRPGVFSARFAGAGATDAQNVAKLLGDLLEGEDRAARFVCSLCLVLPVAVGDGPGDNVIEVRGTLEGRIVLEPRGVDGFGYDPVFEPQGWTQTLAEATPADKDAVSHRGVASRELLKRLPEAGIAPGGAA